MMDALDSLQRALLDLAPISFLRCRNNERCYCTGLVVIKGLAAWTE